MVLPTFDHVTPEKQERVRRALLNEFGAHPLAEAQVARIVHETGIARGAFYKYFTDLQDAYQYIFSIAMRQIHAGLPAMPTLSNTDAYVDSIRHFITAIDEGGYRDLITMHYRYNEAVLGVQPSRLPDEADGPLHWAITVLYHQTVRDIILAPATMDARIAQLQAVLRRGEA
jgi:AcrR family transcriptional regulator